MNPDMVLRRAIIAARSAPARCKPARRVQPIAIVVERAPIVALPPTEPEPTPPTALHVNWYDEIEDYRLMTMDKIKRAVSTATGVSVRDMISRRRFGPIVQARQIAMYLCKELTSQSLPAIGRAFGDRDHSTVFHAYHKIADQIATDPEFAARVAQIRKAINA